MSNSDPSIQTVKALIDKAQHALEAKAFYHRETLHLDIVLLVLISKAIRVSQATCTLVEAGFCEEAFGLSRTLVDIFLTIRYISNKDSLDRAEKFVKFWSKDYTEWIKLIGKYYSKTSFTPPPHHEEMIQLAQGYPSPHKWTGLGDQTRQMAAEPSAFESSPTGGPVTALFDYEAIFKWTSHFVHPTVAAGALDSHWVELGNPFTVHSNRNYGEKFGPLALFNVVTFLAKIFLCGFRGLKSEMPQELSEEWDKLIRSFVPSDAGGVPASVESGPTTS
jgi:hypothetical protein